MKAAFASAILLVSVSACSGALDVGETQASTPPGGSSGTSQPTAACKPLGADPVLLMTFKEEQVQLMRPLSDGAKVWFVRYGTSTSASLWSVDVATGNAGPLPVTGFTGGLYTLFGNAIAFVRTDTQTSSSLVLHDLVSSAERVLPNPPGTTMVAALRGHPSGVYWSSRSEAGNGPISVSRYTSPAAPQASLAVMRNYSALVTDGERLFYTRYADDGTSAVSIMTVPIDGKAEPMPFVSGFDSRKEIVQVFAANEKELFYTVSRLEDGSTVREGDIRATTKDGKTTRTIATGQTFGGISDVNVAYDPDYLTWVDGNAQADILRVKHAVGGAVERIAAQQATRYVNGVTADACNLFWTSVNPPALYGRSR